MGMLALTACSKAAEDFPAAKSPSKSSRTQGILPKDPTLPANTARVDEARIRVELAATRSAVREYQMLNGGFPPDLNRLHLTLRFRADLQYDPQTGQVKSRTYSQY